MTNQPFIPSVKNLLNSDDGHPSSHRQSSADRHHHPSSRPASRHALSKQRTIYQGTLSSSHHQMHPQLPSVREVLQGVNMRSYDSQHRSSSSSRPFTTDLVYDKQSEPAISSSKKGYPCERCGRMFTRKSDALKHIRVVHDRLKVFACSVCARRFARKDYCTKHEKSLHNITPPPSPYQIRRQLAKEQSEARRKAGSSN